MFPGILTYLTSLLGHGWMLAIIFVFVVMAIIVAFTGKAEDEDDNDDYSMSYQFGQGSPYYSPPGATHHHLDQPINAGQNYHIHNETDGRKGRRAWPRLFACCCSKGAGTVDTSLKRRAMARAGGFFVASVFLGLRLLNGGIACSIFIIFHKCNKTFEGSYKGRCNKTHSRSRPSL